MPRREAVKVEERVGIAVKMKVVIQAEPVVAEASQV